MDKIRDWLYIGSLRDTIHPELLNAAGIGAMLQLAYAAPQEGIPHNYLPVEDGEELPIIKLQQGLAFISEQRKAGKTVLVACGRGVSRSATFTIAALKEAEGLSLPDALRAVVAAHRETRPHIALWKSLCAYYNEPFDLKEMLRICRPVGWT